MNLVKEKKRLKRKLNKPSKKEIDLNSYHFAIFSAHLKRFLPEIHMSDYSELFKKFRYYEWASTVEQYDMDYLKKTTITNNSSVDLSNTNQPIPLIFTSFHFGSFRLLNSILYELGHKVVVIIDDIKGAFQQLVDDIFEKVVPQIKGTENSDFVILNVMDRTSIFKLKEYITQGYVMTVYLDGNLSVDNDRESFTKGYIPIKFLKRHLYVKNGVGKLAAMLEAMIIPSIALRDKNDINTFTFKPELKISDFVDRKEFAIKSIEQTYLLFEKEMLKDPMQWGAWMYIHKWFKRNYTTPYKKNTSTAHKFNTKRYTLFRLGDSNYIFDLNDYRIFPIDNIIAKALKNNKLSSIKPTIYEEFMLKNILV